MSTISWAALLFGLLVSIAAIITPLGLHDDIGPSTTTTLVSFHYVKDTSPLGRGTPDRPSEGISPICRGGLVACPNTGQEITMFDKITFYTNGSELGSTLASKGPYGYDTKIPQKLVDFMNSGLSQFGGTVSSPFDIQWRTWRVSDNSTYPTSTRNTTNDTMIYRYDQKFYNNGTPYAIGTYRPITNLLLNDAWEVVEGLIVDSKSGGVGFRNHTVPAQHLAYGGRWTEDLLYIEPVSECVNLNITLDFTLVASGSTIYVAKPRLVDHGGFVNFDKTPISFKRIGDQTDPQLYERAYNAAWATNLLLMLMLNITDYKEDHFYRQPPFSYLSSTLGAEIPLPQFDDGTMSARIYEYDSFGIFGTFSSLVDQFLDLPVSFNVTLPNTTSTVHILHEAPNPWNLTQNNFTTISK